MKCPPCKSSKCGGKYKNRNLCVGGNCRCVCKIKFIVEIFKKGAPIVTGICFVAGGIYVISGRTGFITGSVAGAMVGGGTVLITETLTDAIYRKQVDFEKLGKSTFGGGFGGCITGAVGSQIISYMTPPRVETISVQNADEHLLRVNVFEI